MTTIRLLAHEEVRCGKCNHMVKGPMIAELEGVTPVRAICLPCYKERKNANLPLSDGDGDRGNLCRV